VDPTRTQVRARGFIGHELQHALEALSNPKVRDGTAMFHWFRQFARTDSGAFETTEAIEIGLECGGQGLRTRQRDWSRMSASLHRHDFTVNARLSGALAVATRRACAAQHASQSGSHHLTATDCPPLGYVAVT
jgi:hypothetical protein